MPRKKVPPKSEKTPATVSGPAVPLYDYQKRWVLDQSRFKIGLWCRQAGKSFAAALEAVFDCEDKRADWVFLSSGERQSKEFIRKAKMHLRALHLASTDGMSDFKGQDGNVYKQLEIILKNGSRMLALPANPDTARGHSANVVLDEFAFHQDSRKIWSALFPTITRGYKIRVISTPQGRKNKFYDLWAGNPRFAKHFVDIHTAVDQGLPLYGDDGELVGPDYLKEALDDDEAWLQEYECQFVDEATSFIVYDLITECQIVDLDLERAVGLYPVYAGIDIGRKVDRTIFWAIEVVGDVYWTLRIVELEKMRFTEQLNRLLELIQETNPRRICVDATGIGAQLAETLGELLGSHRVEEVHFRNTVKEDLAIRAKRIFEERAIRIPVDRKLREDIHNIKKTVTAAGNIRFDAERTKDGHSDRFWAMALSFLAASNPVHNSKGILVANPWTMDRYLGQYDKVVGCDALYHY